MWSIRQIGPGVIIALGIMGSRVRLASALGVVWATQVRVIVGVVGCKAAGVATDDAKAGFADAVASVIISRRVGAGMRNGPEACEQISLACAGIWREAQGLALLAAGNVRL